MTRAPIPPKPKAPYPFAGRQPTTNPHLSRIFETVFEVDIWGEFSRLKDSLKVGEQHRDYATLMKALDEAEDNSRIAHSLFCTAKLLHDSFEGELATVEAAMRKEANNALQAEKDKGQRSKAITEADVIGQCMTLFPDQWAQAQGEKQRHKLAVEHLSHLVECWKSRCRTLQTMLAKVR